MIEPLINGLLAALLVLPFVIASRRVSWGALFLGLLLGLGVSVFGQEEDPSFLTCVLTGVGWGLPLFLAGVYGLKENPSQGAEAGVGAPG